MTTPLQAAIAAIKSCPRLSANRIHWAGKPDVMAMVAIAIIGAKDQDAATKAITEATGVREWALRHFVRGNDAQGRQCEVIRSGLQAVGLKPIWLNSKQSSAAAAPLPAADEVPPAKPIMLATTNKGEVITATPPVANGSPMAAKPGDYATKADAARCVFDTSTNDLLVITTRRIPFRSPEWCDKVVEINRKPKG